MRIPLLMLLLSITTTTAVCADFQSFVVTVDTGNKNSLQFMQRPRLAELLQQLDPADELYWPAARFYRDDALRHYGFERQRQNLLSQFAELRQLAGKAAVPESFVELVRTARLASPVALTLDPDAVSGKDALNKQLDNGNYLLRVAKRPTELEIVGFAGLARVAHSYTSTVRDYTSGLAFSELSDQSVVYLLSPSLKVVAAGRALWNASTEQLRPGTLLYIPVDESALPSSFQGINQQVIEFLKHRVTE
jgi:hypothetical protein